MSEKWLDNIIIGRFPVTEEIQTGIYKDVKVVINVSDEFYLGNAEDITNCNKLNYFFPMGESGKSMGLSSLFEALQVLYQVYTFNPNWKVLLHCQAGKNRSPTVKAASHYMMLGYHSFEDNRLLYNCLNGHLPPLEKVEAFLDNFDTLPRLKHVGFLLILS